MAVDSETGWEAFVGWAQMFRQTPNFEVDERINKTRAIVRVSEARALLLESGYFLDTANRAFRSPDNTFVPQKVYVGFLDWVSKNIGPATAALRDLWQTSPDGPFANNIDAFWSYFPDKVVDDFDNRANIASYLLSGIDMFTFPIFRPAAVETSFEQTGIAPPAPDATVGERYDAAVALFDRFINEASEHGLTIADRLEAQALSFAVTSAMLRPGNFSESEWDEFVGYRSTPVRAARKVAAAAARSAAAGRKAPAPRKSSSSPRTPRAATPKPVKPTRPPRGVCPLCGSDEEVRMTGKSETAGRWEYVCEGRDAHDEDFKFSMQGLKI